ncbi:MAG: thiamine phosphate synthase [Thermoleophilaceae bacterium]
MNERLQSARLYFVVEAGASDRLLDAALAGGVDLLQLRDKDAGDDELLRAAERFRDACDRHDALFIVNDRPDLALASGADGVHVGQDDDPVADVRRVLGPDVVIGLSTHSDEQFDAGLESTADYLCCGPVWATPTKAGRPATGLEVVRHAAAVGTKPFFAIGGIDESNVQQVVDAGASRIVVVRAIRDADDPMRAAKTLRAAVESAHVA